MNTTRQGSKTDIFKLDLISYLMNKLDRLVYVGMVTTPPELSKDTYDRIHMNDLGYMNHLLLQYSKQLFADKQPKVGKVNWYFQRREWPYISITENFASSGDIYIDEKTRISDNQEAYWQLVNSSIGNSIQSSLVFFDPTKGIESMNTTTIDYMSIDKLCSYRSFLSDNALLGCSHYLGRKNSPVKSLKSVLSEKSPSPLIIVGSKRLSYVVVFLTSEVWAPSILEVLNSYIQMHNGADHDDLILDTNI